MARELEIRPLSPDEIEPFIRMSHYAFHGRSLEQRRADFAGRVTPERDVLVAWEDGQIVSQVMIYEFGIWIDGVRYPTGSLANVVTAPEKSRQGYARQMLRATLRWMREQLGQSLSTLYPTVYPVYRGLGWALADDSRQLVGPPAAFRPNSSLPVDSGSRLVRRVATIEDVDLLAPVYEKFARERSSYLDRPRWWWEPRVLKLIREDPSWVGLWYGSDGALAGYVVYSFEGANAARLQVYEVVALRPEVYPGVLTFLASHNLARDVAVSAGRDVPWRSLVANPQHLSVEVNDQETFMLRIVDFQRAIGSRAATRDARLPAVNLRVVDESAPWNDGTWRIEATGASWTTLPAPDLRPDATADISTISALFNGFLTVAEAADSGLLHVDAEARPTLEAIFRTKYPPTSRDHF